MIGGAGFVSFTFVGECRSYSWPVRDDECWVADTDIVCTLKSLTTATGRQYHLEEEDNSKILKAIQQ